MIENRDRIGLEASILRCGYDAGYFCNDDIEHWAERQIAVIDELPLPLIELATIRRTHPLDVMNLLRLLAAGVQPKDLIETQIGFIGLAFDSGQLSLRGSIKGLWALLHEDGLTSEQEFEIYSLDDHYDFALCGTHGTMMDVESHVREFVMPYAEKMKQFQPELLARVARVTN